MIPILRAIALRKKQNKDTGLKMAWLWPFWLVFGLSDTLYNLTICEKDVICVHPSNVQHGLQEFAETENNLMIKDFLDETTTTSY